MTTARPRFVGRSARVGLVLVLVGVHLGIVVSPLIEASAASTASAQAWTYRLLNSRTSGEFIHATGFSITSPRRNILKEISAGSEPDPTAMA